MLVMGNQRQDRHASSPREAAYRREFRFEDEETRAEVRARAEDCGYLVKGKSDPKMVVARQETGRHGSPTRRAGERFVPSDMMPSKYESPRCPDGLQQGVAKPPDRGKSEATSWWRPWQSEGNASSTTRGVEDDDDEEDEDEHVARRRATESDFSAISKRPLARLLASNLCAPHGDMSKTVAGKTRVSSDSDTENSGSDEHPAIWNIQVQRTATGTNGVAKDGTASRANGGLAMSGTTAQAPQDGSPRKLSPWIAFKNASDNLSTSRGHNSDQRMQSSPRSTCSESSFRSSTPRTGGERPGRTEDKKVTFGECRDGSKKDTGDGPAKYRQLIEEAKKASQTQTFPQEWHVQLLVDCGYTEQGERLLLFTPAFLQHALHDKAELDQAFRYMLYVMDRIVRSEPYIFVYCHSESNISDPEMVQRLQLAYEILPRCYSKRLRRFIIMHATGAFRLFLNLTSAWMLDTGLREKVEYMSSLDTFCEDMHPTDITNQMEVRRQFPHLVQREDAVWAGLTPPAAFGVHLQQVCETSSVDFIDEGNGRWYPRLPSALIVLCEALERRAGDEGFAHMFSAEGSVLNQMATLDAGLPLDPDLPDSVLWCTLKLFLDRLPTPLLSAGAFAELGVKGIKVDDKIAQRKFLLEVLRSKMPDDFIHVTLYLASFFLKMCRTAKRRADSSPINTRRIPAGFMSSPAKSSAEQSDSSEEEEHLTPSHVAQVFAPGFLRPRVMTAEAARLIPVAVSVVDTLICSAEEAEFNVGKPDEFLRRRRRRVIARACTPELLCDGYSSSTTDDA